LRTPGRGRDPGALLPWWIVANVLRMSTLEVRNPLLLFILMKGDDTSRQSW